MTELLPPPSGMPPSRHLARHLTDSLALSTTVTLAYTLVELLLLDMSGPMSARARLIVVVAIFGGIGSIIARSRDASQRWLGLNINSREPMRLAHDVVFNVVANALLAPAFYLLAGADFEEAARATLASIVLAAATGPINGFAIDLFRHWGDFSLPQSRLAAKPERAWSGRSIALACCSIWATTCWLYAHFG